jgi:hypothetical protein
MSHRSRCLVLTVTCIALPILSSAACSREQEPDSKKSNTGKTPAAASAPAAANAAAVNAAATKPNAEKDGTLLELGSRFGKATDLNGEASYTIKRKVGLLVKELKLEVDNAAPDTTYPVTLDGASIGKMVTNAKGDAKLNVVENKDQLFPEGFSEPKAGSVIRIGEIMDLHFFALVRLKDLEARIAGPDKLSGKVTFKVEQLGKDVTREFLVKFTGAQAKTVLPVTLADVHVGDITVDLEGVGRLLLSTKKGPLPASFPEPEVGAKVKVGDLFAGELKTATTNEKKQ